MSTENQKPQKTKGEPIPASVQRITWYGRIENKKEMMMKVIYLMMCSLLVLGCSKDDQNPEEEKQTNKGTYFEVTISGPLEDGEYKWVGNKDNVSPIPFVAAYEHLGASADIAMIRYYGSGQVTPIVGGMQVPPSKGTYRITDVEGAATLFSVGTHVSTYREFDVEVKVTEFEEIGETSSFRLIKRIYGTFEGTVIENVNEAGVQGQLHTVKGRFGYDSTN